MKAAGNGGDANASVHAKITVPTGKEIVVPFELYDKRGPRTTRLVNCVPKPFFPDLSVSVWYRDDVPPLSVSVACRVPTEQTFSGDVFGGLLSTIFDATKRRQLFHQPAVTVQRPKASGGTVSVRRRQIDLTISASDRAASPQYAQGIYELRFTAPAGTVLHALCDQYLSLGIGLKVAERGHDGTPLSPEQDSAIDVTNLSTLVDSCARNIIVAAAYDDDDGDTSVAPRRAVAAFSSRGPLRDFSNPQLGPLHAKPDIAGPGVKISAVMSKDADDRLLSLLTPGFLAGNRFEPNSGTSMSAPMVAGVIALMLEKNPALSVDEVRTVLTAAGNVRDGTSPAKADAAAHAGAYGAGMIDALLSHEATPSP